MERLSQQSPSSPDALNLQLHLPQRLLGSLDEGEWEERGEGEGRHGGGEGEGGEGEGGHGGGEGEGGRGGGEEIGRAHV